MLTKFHAHEFRPISLVTKFLKTCKIVAILNIEITIVLKRIIIFYSQLDLTKVGKILRSFHNFSCLISVLLVTKCISNGIIYLEQLFYSCTKLLDQITRGFLQTDLNILEKRYRFYKRVFNSST